MNLMIGADPEFAIVQNGGVVGASRFFTEGYTGPLGVDGGGILAEIRPRPSEDIFEVVESCIELMQAADAIVPAGYEFYAGAKYASNPIGGHIHFGGVRNEQEIVEPFIKNMDFINKMLTRTIEPTDDVAARRRTGYGRIGSWRRQDHGVEYRSPLSWLISPSVTAIYLGLQKLAITSSFKGTSLAELFGTVNPGISVARKLRKALKYIPEDCSYAIDLYDELREKTKQELLDMWHKDMRNNWKETNADMREVQPDVQAVESGVVAEPTAPSRDSNLNRRRVSLRSVP